MGKRGTKRPSRAESRKPPKIAKVPDIINELPGEDMRIAAMTLALNGYQKNQNRRTGAVTHAARLASVAPKTIYDWLKDPQFVTAIEEATSELIAECFVGYRVGAREGDGRCISDMLAHLDPDLDLAIQRKRKEWEHEERMLRLKIELATLQPDDDLPLPQIIFRETAPGERIAAIRDEDETQH